MTSVEQSDLDKFNIKVTTFDKFKKGFNTVFPDMAYGLFFVYFVKPIFVGIIFRCRRLSNQTYYTSDMYFMRMTYDFFFILPTCLYPFLENLIGWQQFILFLAPVVCLEILIYIISVKPGNEKARKIHFRMVKVYVTTQQENDAMWSTDDEPEEGESESASHVSFSDIEFNLRKESIFRKEAVSIIGGPFNVDIRKPYKPVMICFVDLIVALSFFNFTLMYYWKYNF